MWHATNSPTAILGSARRTTISPRKHVAIRYYNGIIRLIGHEYTVTQPFGTQKKHSLAILPSVECTQCRVLFHSSPVTVRSFREVSSQSTTTSVPEISTGAASSAVRRREAVALYLAHDSLHGSQLRRTTVPATSGCTTHEAVECLDTAVRAADGYSTPAMYTAVLR